MINRGNATLVNNSIKVTYFHSKSAGFNKCLDLVRDQVPYPEILM
jgi:hypothetical protein